MNIDVIDGCAGSGGWSVAAAALGLHEVGIELDPWACATRTAAGHLTVRADVSALPLHRMAGRMRGLIFSPPCGTFSAAGKGEGIDDLPLLHQALDDLAAGHDARAQLAAACSDPRTPLVVEPLRYALAIRPQWIALEQVPAVLPLWRHIARILRGLGYSAWAGILNAADFGVPQTRKRAILIASRVRPVAPPEPTHAKDAEPESLFGPGRERWVSMAQALGWGATDRPVPTVTAGGGNTGGAEPFPTRAREILASERDRGAWVLHTNRAQRPDGSRQTADPYTGSAPSLTGKSGGQWLLRNNTQANAGVRRLDEPAGTLFFGHPRDVVAVVAEEQGPGGPESVRITVEEGAVLQSFPADYPFQGTKTAKFLQVGNAWCPRAAMAVLGAAAGIDWRPAAERHYGASQTAAALDRAA